MSHRAVGNLAAGVLAGLVVLPAVVASDLEFSTQTKVTIRTIAEQDLGYFLAQVQIYAESPWPYLPPTDFTTGVRFRYRIMGLTHQGNCVGMCPASTIFVVISDYWNYSKWRIQLYRIDGVRSLDSVEVEGVEGRRHENCLSFTFNSRPHPGETHK